MQETCDKGTKIFKEGELSNSVFIVKSGIVEVQVTIEGHPLSIERLFRGSIINHNAFLIGDYCDVSGHCVDTLTIFFLPYPVMDKIRMRHPDLSVEIDKVREKSNNAGIPFIVDYIIGKNAISAKKTTKVAERRAMLACRMKNLALYLLAKVKASLNKASFREVLMNVIATKKAEIQRERKKKLMPGSSEAMAPVIKEGINKG